MTAKAWAPSQPLVPDLDVACSIEAFPSKAGLNSRGYSDSEIPSCKASGGKRYHIGDFAPVRSDLAAVAGQTTNMHSLPPLVKGRQQHLQLPSFKSLGISSRVPDALLTPPDESLIYDLMEAPPPTSFPSVFRRSSYPALNMPKTPSPDRPGFSSVLGLVATASEASATDASNQPSLPVSETQAGNLEHGADPSRSDSEGSDTVSGQFDWLKEATDALGELHEVNDRYRVLLADYPSCQYRFRCYELCRVHTLPYPALPSHEHCGQTERREQATGIHW